MAIELFRRVSSFTTQRGRVAMYHARKNRLSKLVVTKSIILLWNINSNIPFSLGTGIATGVGEAINASIGSITGTGTVIGVSGVIESVGSIIGTGTATGVGAEA